MGCGGLLAIFLAFAAFGAVYGALAGDYGLGWQIGAWIGLVVVVLVAVVAGIAFLDEKLGWGLAEPTPDTGSTVSAEEVLADDAKNYGGAESRQEPSERDEPETSAQEGRGRWISHPDDPPSGTDLAPDEEPEAPPVTPPDVEIRSESKVYDQIRRLAELRDEGLITPEEFEA